MGAIIAFFLTPIGRWVGIGLASLLLSSGIYMKGRWDQRSADRLKIQREANDAIKKGEAGRAQALQRFKDNKIPDSWFRDD
jgi:hypothetical protein